MTSEIVEYLPEETLIRKALAALIEALGPVEATRFLSLARSRKIDSVERHRDWQESLDKDTFFNEIFI